MEFTVVGEGDGGTAEYRRGEVSNGCGEGIVLMMAAVLTRLILH